MAASSQSASSHHNFFNCINIDDVDVTPAVGGPMPSVSGAYTKVFVDCPSGILPFAQTRSCQLGARALSNDKKHLTPLVAGPALLRLHSPETPVVQLNP